MKFIFSVFIIFFSVFSSYPVSKFTQINTILVIVEENENNELLLNEAPVTDGIYDTLWNYEEYIFFDMKLNQGLKITNNQLDASGFTLVAKESGADSILLIKISYSTALQKDKLNLKTNFYYYKLISLNKFDILKNEKVILNTEENILVNDKNIKLKKIGEDIIKRIFG